MTPLEIDLVRLAHADGLDLPSYATPGAAGLDLLAAIAEPVDLAPGARALIPTGLTIALPAGYEAQVRPRSGLALKHGITVLNSPGTIDADYRGEIGIVLINLGNAPVRLERGMRVAQLIVAPVTQVALVERRTLPPTNRAGGGFGSTGR
ncbi:MAG: dUTP diphosphatase [Tagaea sp.]|nr:dUTP diphosphatase [Tagaea sp.]